MRIFDTPWVMTKFGGFDLNTGRVESQFNYPLAKAGGLTGAIFSLYLKDELQDKMTMPAIKTLIDSQIKWIEKCERPDFKIMFGLEGGRLLHRDLDYLAELSGRIVYLGLTHNRNTSWADSSTDSPSAIDVGGLSRFGKEVIKHCNKLGVLVDISHASDKTALAALDISQDPVIASHSGCKKLLSHPRNLTDELISLVAATGGVVCVPFARRFVGDEIKDVTNHIDHIVQLVGIDHVGIGSDLDGAELIPQCGSVADWSKVVIEPLLARGYKMQDVEQIAGGNLLRVIEEGS